MTIALPVSGVEVAWWIPPLAGFAVSIATSVGGVSGAFLLLPFQLSVLGVTAPCVSATNHVFNAVAVPGGVRRYVREGRMVWPLFAVLAAGAVPGAVAGAVARITALRDPQRFTGFVALVLLYIGVRMAWDLARAGRRPGPAAAAEHAFHRAADELHHGPDGCADLPATAVEHVTLRETAYTFCGERFTFSTPGVAALGFVVGLVGGSYGIGGGALVAPLLVGFCGLPIYTIAGAVLLATGVTSLASALAYQALAALHAAPAVGPDWALGLLFGAGGLGGIYLGARWQKYVPSRAIRWMLVAVILATAGRYVANVWR